MVALPFVEIPGYREAVKRERTLRDSAFLDGNEVLCGETVVPLSLRRLIWLEQAHNGFICPWRWDSEEQVVGHAVALVFFCTPDFKPPTDARYSRIRAFLDARRELYFSKRIFSRLSPDDMIKEVRAWLDDAFMDAPVGESGGSGQSYASYPAYIFDRLGEAGLTYTPDQILDMPLKRLWQHLRVASARIGETKLTNPSDQLAVNHIATLSNRV